MRLTVVCWLVLTGACAGESSVSTTIVAAPVTTMEDMPVTFTLDVTGPFTSAGVLQPSHGTATIDGLVVSYTPNGDYFGPDVMRAYVTTDGPFVETAFDITVLPVNDAPVGLTDTFHAVEDMPFTVPSEMLLANDSDTEGEPITITAVGNAVHGTVSLAQGEVTFVPTADFNRVATFDYVSTDGMDTSTSHVEVYFANTDDPPIAVADTAVVAMNTRLDLTVAELLANDYDADGSATLTFVNVANCVNCVIFTGLLPPGHVRISPAQNFTGTASVEYTITDGVATSTAMVTITVTP